MHKLYIKQNIVRNLIKKYDEEANNRDLLHLLSKQLYYQLYQFFLHPSYKIWIKYILY